MNSSNFASDDARQSRSASSAEERRASQPFQDPELLDRVLRSTLAMIQSDEAMEPQEMDALLGVARRHRGEALSAEPIAQELVDAMLRPKFGSISESDEFWRRMSAWIASTMMDDPPARQRLESLWERLLDKTA